MLRTWGWSFGETCRRTGLGGGRAKEPPLGNVLRGSPEEAPRDLLRGQRPEPLPPFETDSARSVRECNSLCGMYNLLR